MTKPLHLFVGDTDFTLSISLPEKINYVCNKEGHEDKTNPWFVVYVKVQDECFNYEAEREALSAREIEEIIDSLYRAHWYKTTESHVVQTEKGYFELEVERIFRRIINVNLNCVTCVNFHVVTENYSWFWRRNYYSLYFNENEQWHFWRYLKDVYDDLWRFTEANIPHLLVEYRDRFGEECPEENPSMYKLRMSLEENIRYEDTDAVIDEAFQIIF